MGGSAAGHPPGGPQPGQPDQRAKVVVRHLPPALSEEGFRSMIPNWLPRADYFYYVPGKQSLKELVHSRAYLRFSDPADVLRFTHQMDGHAFLTERGTQYRCSVEYAPYQKVPKARNKRDPRENTLERDADFKAFLERLQAGPTPLPSAEAQLASKEAGEGGAVAGGAPTVVTALMQFIKEKRLGPKPAPATGGKGAKGGAKAAGQQAQQRGGKAGAKQRRAEAGAAPAAAPQLQSPKLLQPPDRKAQQAQQAAAPGPGAEKKGPAGDKKTGSGDKKTAAGGKKAAAGRGEKEAGASKKQPGEPKTAAAGAGAGAGAERQAGAGGGKEAVAASPAGDKVDKRKQPAGARRGREKQGEPAQPAQQAPVQLLKRAPGDAGAPSAGAEAAGAEAAGATRKSQARQRSSSSGAGSGGGREAPGEGPPAAAAAAAAPKVVLRRPQQPQTGVAAGAGPPEAGTAAAGEEAPRQRPGRKERTRQGWGVYQPKRVGRLQVEEEGGGG